MELRLDTPVKFRHPCYEALTWFAAKDYLKELKSYCNKGISPPSYFLEGMKEMLYCFTRWTKSREVSRVQPRPQPLATPPMYVYLYMTYCIYTWCTCMYSETSNKGPSKTRMQYKNPLQRTFLEVPKNTFPIVIKKKAKNLREEVKLSTKVKASEFIHVLFPTRPFVQKFHCIYCIHVHNHRKLYTVLNRYRM